MPLGQPGEIAVDARPRERVVDKDVMALAREAVRDVLADEARAAGHQDWLAPDERWSRH
jgi:hypothetical protein